MKKLLILIMMLASFALGNSELMATELAIITYESHPVVLADRIDCMDEVYPEAWGTWCILGSFDNQLFIHAVQLTPWEPTHTHWIEYPQQVWGVELVHPSGINLLIYVDYEVNLTAYILNPGQGLPPVAQ